MERIQFKISIHSTAEKVYDTMLGQDTFKLWTGIFNPTSNFEGNWAEGNKILFTCINDAGKREGMVGVVRELNPNRFVSVEYTGILDGDKEIMEGNELESWAGAFENYSFEEYNGVTTVTVDMDVNAEMQSYFEQTYPKALEKLKEICEA